MLRECAADQDFTLQVCWWLMANLNDADRVSSPEQLNNEAERHGRMGYSPENKIAATAFVILRLARQQGVGKGQCSRDAAG